MKKIIVSSVLAVTCLLSSAFAFSWSGLVDNNTKISENHDFSKPVLNQSNGVYLSGYSNIGDAGNMRFTAEALYKYSFNYDIKDNKSDLKNVADLDLFKFAGEWAVGPGKVSLSAGRFQYSDFSDAVFKQVSDGLYINFNNAKMKGAVYAGYTGLLNRLNVSMAENDSEENEQFYALCPMYIPVLADFSYKALFESHTIGLQLAGFIPLKEENKRQDIINSYLEISASDLPEFERKKIAHEVLSLVNAPQYAPLFSVNSVAEAAVMGEVDGRIISGQIDRLVVTDSKVMIIDYKTNRPAAQNLADVPPAYCKQMQAYRSLITKLYPDKQVETYILWTNTAQIMEIK